MATFPREHTVRGDAAACKELAETHLKGIKLPVFQAYTLVGQDKDPLALHLYKSAQPPYDEQPVAVYKLNEAGVFELQVQERRGKK